MCGLLRRVVGQRGGDEKDQASVAVSSYRYTFLGVVQPSSNTCLKGAGGTTDHKIPPGR